MKNKKVGHIDKSKVDVKSLKKSIAEKSKSKTIRK